MLFKMIKSKIFRFFGVFFCFLFCFNFAFSLVEVFSNYDTVLKINSKENFIEVNKSLTLKNVYDVGIVPGQIEFKIAKGLDNSIKDLSVLEVFAKDRFGEQIKINVRETKDFTVFILDIYYPLLPGFEYEFDLYYKLSFDSGGIFFKSLKIPIRESTIPIEKGKFRVILPKNYHFTYFDPKQNLKVLENDFEAVWNIENNKPDSIAFEYSLIKVFRFFNLKGSYVFWIFVNLILVFVLIYEVRKEIKKFKKNEN